MVPVTTLAVFLLITVGVYLLMHRSLLRVAMGLGCLGHGIHLILLAAGRWGSRAPLVMPGTEPTDVTDPIPQAFVLTAIVISMAITLYLLAVTVVHTRNGGRAELVAAPESDEGRSPESLAAEFSGGREDPA